MAPVRRPSPWHSAKSDVHHDHPDCVTGRRVAAENARAGTGGKPRCRRCAALARARRGRDAAAALLARS